MKNGNPTVMEFLVGGRPGVCVLSSCNGGFVRLDGKRFCNVSQVSFRLFLDANQLYYRIVLISNQKTVTSIENFRQPGSLCRPCLLLRACVVCVCMCV